MKRRKHNMRNKSLITGCIVLLFLIVAVAATSYAESVIYGCVNKKFGTLRVVSSPTQCKPLFETSISWNNYKIIHGWVESEASEIRGTGFSAVFTGVAYIITFTTPFDTVPTCMAASDHFGVACTTLDTGNTTAAQTVVECSATYLIEEFTAVEHLETRPFSAAFNFICVQQ